MITKGYYKLKTIVKENVKAVLSENKKLISVFFAVLIHTIKADPQMINLFLTYTARMMENIKIVIILSNTLNPIRITY